MTSKDGLPGPGGRALLMARVSRGEDTSTSIPQQLERLRMCRKSYGWVAAGEVEHRSVFDGIEPAKRPALGPWLSPEGLRLRDVMIVDGQDRLRAVP
jgi:hypothetical protein